MLAFYHPARPRALFYAAISAGLLALPGASLRAAEKPPVNTVRAVISGFNSPLGIAVSSDSKWVYVANNGNNTVSTLDAGSNQFVGNILNAGNQPVDLAITSNGQKLFVSDDAYAGSLYNSGSVTTIDTKTAASTTANTNAPFPSGLALTPDEKHLWIADTGGVKIDVLDVATGKLSPYPIGSLNPRSIVFSPNGKRAYVVTIYGSIGIWVFDVATGKHIQTIPVGNSPYGICLSRDGKTAYVLDQGSVSQEGVYTPDVAVIDTTTNKTTDYVSLPATAGVQLGGCKMALTPDGEYLYVPIEDQYGTLPGSVVMVSTKTKKVVGDPVVLPVGTIYAVAIAPDGKHAYVTNETASTLTVIEISQ